MLTARRCAAIGAAALVPLVVSCSSATEPKTTESAPVSLSTVVGSADPRVDLELDPASQAFLWAAVDRTLAECVRAAGFDWKETPLDIYQSQYRSARDARVGEFPYDAAIEGLPYSNPEAPIVPNVSINSGAGLSENELEQFALVVGGSWDDVVTVDVFGTSMQTPRSGCISKARLRIFGSLEAAFFVESEAANAVSSARHATRQTPEVIEALDHWKMCMAESGHQFVDFTEARMRAHDHPSEAQAVAVADDRCTREANLGRVFDAAFNRAVDEFADSNTAALAEYQVAIDQAIEVAKDVLGS